jgi:hypothetical protein
VHLAYIDCSNLFIEAQKISALGEAGPAASPR